VKYAAIPLILLVLLIALFPPTAAFAQEGSETAPAPEPVPTPEPTPENEGEVTTASGLKYIVQRKGTSAQRPVSGDTVTVHYTGTFTNGKKFDSSVDKGKPFEFMLGVGMVVAGWDEGIALMTVGSQYRFLVPWKLAYGARGRPGIPPKSDLIFVVDLLKIDKGAPVPQFTEGNPEKQQTTASGLTWEVIKEGEGDTITAETSVKIRFALWNENGDLVFCTEASKRFLTGKAGELQIGPRPEKFLKEAIAFMKPGGIYRFEVPPELCWGSEAIGPKLAANSKTIWQLKLDKIVETPAFKPTPAESLTKTESGLGYQVIREGTGANPTAASVVKVHYTGWLESGKVFDSSHARDEPVSFPLGRVIKGWTEGLQLMKVGAIYQFTIPGDLAYGPKAQPRSGIPANATLIFYVELLAIEK